MTTEASLSDNSGKGVNHNNQPSRTIDDDWHNQCKRFVELEEVLMSQLSSAAGLNPNDVKTSGSVRLAYTFRCYKIDPKIRSAVMERDWAQLAGLKPLRECTSVRDYQRCISGLLELEEVYHSIEMRKFDQSDAKVILEYDESGQEKRHVIRMPALSQCPPFDYVIMQSLAETWSTTMRVACEVENDLVVLRDRDLVEHYSEDLREHLSIAPISSGKRFAICQLSIEAPISERLIAMIVGGDEFHYQAQQVDDKVDLELTSTDELLIRLDKLNERQRRAVAGILRARCRPRPYIVTGSSGSGKSQVLVETIVQLYKRTSMSVLVCAQTDKNLAQLMRALNDSLPGASMLRLKEEDNARFVYCRERIVFAKSIKAASLRVKFDYVLLDEANCANVPESLVSASLLKDAGCLVLAGVSEQPGPVVRCKEAAELGLDSSLMHTLMTLEEYRRGQSRGEECMSDCITDLVGCNKGNESILAGVGIL